MLIIMVKQQKFNSVNLKIKLVIKRFMNQAASYVANRKELCRAVEKERLF